MKNVSTHLTTSKQLGSTPAQVSTHFLCPFSEITSSRATVQFTTELRSGHTTSQTTQSGTQQERARQSLEITATITGTHKSNKQASDTSPPSCPHPPRHHANT